MPSMAGLKRRGDLRRQGARARPPLLSPAFRPVAGILAAVCVALTALLGALVAHQARPGWLDIAVDSRVAGSLGGHAAVLSALVRLGNPLSVTVLATALFIACLATRRFRGALLVAVALPAAGLAEIVLKPLIGRTHFGALTFPSGHSIGVFGLAAAIAVLLVGPLRPPAPAVLRLLLAAAALAMAGAVAIALVALHMHYFTDTLGGATVSTSIVLATALVLDAVADRRGRVEHAETAGRLAGEHPSSADSGAALGVPAPPA
jgi:membrane-associated phospholipid phosphatase